MSEYDCPYATHLKCTSRSQQPVFSSIIAHLVTSMTSSWSRIPFEYPSGPLTQYHPRNPCTSYQSHHDRCCAFAVIGTEHDFIFARTLTTATATSSLIAVIPSELVARGPASTSTSTVIASSSSLRLGETLAGRSIPTAVTAGAGSGRGCGCGYSSGSEVLNPPLWVNPSNLTVA